MALFGKDCEVWLSWIKCATGMDFEVSKVETKENSVSILCLIVASQHIRSQLLLLHHACLPDAIVSAKTVMDSSL